MSDPGRLADDALKRYQEHKKRRDAAIRDLNGQELLLLSVPKLAHALKQAHEARQEFEKAAYRLGRSVDSQYRHIKALEKTIRVLRFAANLSLTQKMVPKLRAGAPCEGEELKFCTCGQMLASGTAADEYARKVSVEGE